jgi:hypothetical protein
MDLTFVDKHAFYRDQPVGCEADFGFSWDNRYRVSLNEANGAFYAFNAVQGYALIAILPEAARQDHEGIDYLARVDKLLRFDWAAAHQDRQPLVDFVRAIRRAARRGHPTAIDYRTLVGPIDLALVACYPYQVRRSGRVVYVSTNQQSAISAAYALVRSWRNRRGCTAGGSGSNIRIARTDGSVKVADWYFKSHWSRYGRGDLLVVKRAGA